MLRRACYDCHSNEVVWPWYAQVAPISWLVARDVSEGRASLNYSTWNRLDEDRRILDHWSRLPPRPARDRGPSLDPFAR